MITISAFSHVPDVAKGLVRDLRVRWALEEARLAYQVRLLEQGDQNKPAYRALQPFGRWMRSLPTSEVLRHEARLNMGR